jgi:signal peptidase I
MESKEHDIEPRAPRLERNAMSWPPASWERESPAWRDDISYAPDAFTPETAAKRPPSAMLAREVLETIILTAVIFLGIRLVVQNFRIEGRSMEPTLHSGQYLLVSKLVYSALGEPGRGDVIVFEAWGQDKDFIKRIVGTPGDRVEIRDGCVYINDSCVEEPYLDQPTTDAIGPLTLGEEEFYVLGDNRGNSSDSRAYGPLPRENIIGKAWLTYWPPGAIGLVPKSDESFASTP